MIQIHFIINPVSGNGKHRLTASTIRDFFPGSDYDVSVDYTAHKGHAIQLAKNAAAGKPHYIIACGGDGTVNEVASCLVNTDIVLGIVPIGSGNGLAAHLGIPQNIEKAFAIIKKGSVDSMDVGAVNHLYFFSNMGVAVDAMIIKQYERKGKRGLMAYVKAAVVSVFKFEPELTLLNYGSETDKCKPFLLFISNSNEMGYKMSLTPHASLNDGWLDLFMVAKISLFQQMVLGYCVWVNRIGKFKWGMHSRIQKIRLEQPDTIFWDVQIDGEFHNFKTNVLDVSVINNGLKALLP